MSTSVSTSAGPSTTVLPLALIGFNSSGTYQASIIAANPTATTLFVACTAQDDFACDFGNASVTVGPWAQATPPPTASEGTYDILLTVPAFTLDDISSSSSGSDSTASSAAMTLPTISSTATLTDAGPAQTISLHCQMTHTTVPAACTEYQLISPAGTATDDTSSSTTVTNPNPEKNTASKVDVTVTAGVEKLATLTGSSLSSGMASTASGSGSGTTTSARVTGTGSGRGTGTGTSETATASHTGAAGKVFGSGAVGVLGMMAGLFVL